jgi:hypothetical protein
MPVRELSPPPAPPAAPRAVTPQDQSALLLEPRVRRWWIMAVVILLMCLAFCADRLWARHNETLLIRDGLVVNARITRVDNKVANQPFSSTDHAYLQAALPGGNIVEYDGYLTQGGMSGGTTTLHVDRNDSTHWTDRSEPTPLLDSLFVGILALPVVPLLVLLGYLQLRKLRVLWESGTAALAEVHDRKISPIAPTSYALRACLQDSRNRKLFTVYVPHIGMGLDRGDSIWVITGRNKQQPLAALWMPARPADAQPGKTA